MSAEFWAIIIIGALIWWALVDGIQRIEKAMTQLSLSVENINSSVEKAPWSRVPPPDISELLNKSR